MGYLAAGQVAAVPRGEWDPLFDYKKLSIISYDNRTYMARKPSRGMEPMGATDEYWMLLMEAYLKDMHGATAEKNGSRGLVPQPLAGDEGKVLSGSGEWKYKLQTDILDNDGVIGYINSDNEFVPFFTYEDVIREASIGTADQTNVLEGYTYTSTQGRGLSGLMHDYSHSKLVVTSDESNTNKPYLHKITTNDGNYYEVNMPTGYWSRSPGNSSALVPAEEKTVTATTTTIVVEPSAGKVLSKVTVSGTPTQEKTITASRSQQIVTPDSGKQLSKVIVNKYPDATGVYKPTVNSSASDMGATNNYRYVDTTAIYNTAFTSSKPIKIGTITTNGGVFDLKSYSGYQQFTINNFFCKVDSVLVSFNWAGGTTTGVYYNSGLMYASAEVNNSGTTTITPSMTYNASTGILTVNNMQAQRNIRATASMYQDGGANHNHVDANSTATARANVSVYLIRSGF